MRRHAATVTFALGLGAFSSAQGEPPRPEPTAVDLVKVAEKLLADERFDEGIVALWRAEQALETIDSETTRRAMREGLAAQLGKVDPLDGERRAARAVAAGKLVKLAGNYRRRNWCARALQQLDDAERLSAGSSAKERLAVEKRLARRKPARRSEPEPQPEPEPAGDLLPTMELREVLGDWVRDARGIRSPALEESTVMLFAESPTHEDNLLRIELRIGANEGQAGVIFGATDTSNFYIADVFVDSASRQGSITIWRVTGRTSVEKLVDRGLNLTKEKAADWLKIAVEIRGQQVVATLNGKGRIQVKCPTIPHGGVGLFVSGSSANKAPVEFRELHIDPLPVEKEVEAAAQPLRSKLPAEKLQERIAAAERLITAGQVEDAVLALGSVREDLVTVESDVMRSALEAATRALLETNDPLHAKVVTAHREIAELFVPMGRRYLAAKRPFAATALLERAGGFDDKAVAAELRAARATLEPILAKRRGLAPEPEARADNATGRAWFEGGRQYGVSGWSWRESFLSSPELEDAGTLHVAKRKANWKAGRASVQVRLRGEASAGVAFGVRSLHDYYLAGVSHGKRDSHVFVSRHYNNNWQDIAQRVVRFSPEARAGWMTIDVVHQEGKVVVRVGQAKPIEVAKKDLDPRGTYGFYVWTERRLGSAQFRNFGATETAVPEKKR